MHVDTARLRVRMRARAQANKFVADFNRAPSSVCRAAAPSRRSLCSAGTGDDKADALMVASSPQVGGARGCARTNSMRCARPAQGRGAVHALDCHPALAGC